MTQYDRVLKHLQTCKGLTSFEAFERYGITRLSAVIFDLRQEGFNITTTTVCKKNRYGEPCHFAEYRLEK